MPTNYGAVELQFNHWTYTDPMWIFEVGYTFPLMTTDGFGDPFRIYYGDEIDLEFWRNLGMEYGVPTSGSMWSLQSGYTYKYFITLRRFEIYDDNNILIYEQSDCNTINDLNIDLNIHKSHQFEIILGDGGRFYPWILPAKLVKKVYGPSPVIKYRKINDNCEVLTGLELLSSHDRLYKAKAKYTRKLQKPFSLCGVGGTVKERYSDPFLGFAAQVYVDDFVPFKVIKKPILFRAQSFYIRMLLPFLSISMYPGIQPVLRLNETQNNRPIYEPWLIIMYKFILMHPVDNDDSYGIDLLDLSPNWSY